jgi:cytochrome P450
LAGSETTSNALSGLVARLIWNPKVYEKLVHEIRSTYHTENEITHEILSKMPYLNACIEESLRIHPPVSPGLLRNVPQGGDNIDGKWIPEGTTVSVGSWAASHNPVNFKNPDSFIPERWIDEFYAADLKKAMRPFSLGPRACIGKRSVNKIDVKDS